MGWLTGETDRFSTSPGAESTFWVPAGNGLGRREKPIDSAQVRAPILVALECILDHRQRPAAPQAAEPNASRGLCKS